MDSADQNGWIKLHRCLLEWEWFKDINTTHVFIYLLLKANHKDGRFEGKEIKRGQLFTGRKALAKFTGLSEMKIRTSLAHLTQTGEISIKSTNNGSIITICNYNTYQLTENHVNQQVTSDQPTINQQVTTNKNVITKRMEEKQPPTVPQPESESYKETKKKDTEIAEKEPEFFHRISDVPKLESELNIIPKSELAEIIDAYAKRLNKLPSSINPKIAENWNEILACTSKDWCLTAIKKFPDTHPIGIKIKAQQWEKDNKKSILAIGIKKTKQTIDPAKVEEIKTNIIEMSNPETKSKRLEIMRKAMIQK